MNTKTHTIYMKDKQMKMDTIYPKIIFGLAILTFAAQVFGADINKDTINDNLELTHSSQVEKSKDNIIYINNFPVKTGWLSSSYGMRNDPFNGKRRMHKGIDIAARQGTNINPVGKGTVIFAGRKHGYGKLIEIRHGNSVVSRYAHLKKILAKKGQKVNMTDIIAQVGSTGRSTGPHLHLEIAFNGKTVNPRIYLTEKVAMR